MMVTFMMLFSTSLSSVCMCVFGERVCVLTYSIQSVLIELMISMKLGFDPSRDFLKEAEDRCILLS